MGGMGGGRFPGRGQRLGGGRGCCAADADRCDVLPAGAAVELLELSNQPELNGQKGVVERYDDARKRYHVAVNGATVALRPANVRQVIAEARVAGTSQPELNGRVAAVVSSDAERYTVRLPHETVRLRFGA